MADPIWPVTNDMPQDMLVEGLSFSEQDTLRRFNPQNGPEIIASKFTAASTYFSGRVVLDTQAQLNDLLNFWLNTIKRGALKFDWKNPLTQTVAKCRLRKFIPIPQGTYSAGPFEISIELEVLP